MFDPLDFISRLVALIPPPRFHMLRYHGVLAAHAKARGEVVPEPEPAEPRQLHLAAVPEPRAESKRSQHPWAYLLRRVFAVDVMVCPRCRGPMKLLKIAKEPDAIARALAAVGLGPPKTGPPRPRPALPGQRTFRFAA